MGRDKEVDVEPVRFVLCVHNHQPVGNFDHVIEDAYQRAYLPFLEVMEGHPGTAWVLHNSGCLWEWLEEHHPEYIDRIARGAREGRIELLAGGFYEPVLPACTREDRRGQIARMRDYLERRFGVTPRGIWLTERVWEPDLPADLAAAGINHLPIDDTQLHQVGVHPESVRGPFLTESSGQQVHLFPALMSLRYKIPYAEPEAVAEFLADPFPGGGTGLAVYADDGEKFGVWPGTHKRIYTERWLDRFLTAVEQASGITTTTFERELATTEAESLVYLPAGSYAEMGEWSLPPDFQERLARARETLEREGLEDDARLFLRGGFWRNFFARYPESSWMHMRTLEASTRCRTFRSAMKRATWENVRDHFWRAQCNCAYWHGVFGGLYLPHLRHGIYAELIRGEAHLARSLHGRRPFVASRSVDLDVDGRDEIVLENEAQVLFVDPDKGGRLVEWDDRAAAINLVNVLSRRPEYYHREVREPAEAAKETAETIHTAVRAKEAGLRELLTYDWYERAALTDRFFDERPDPERLVCAEARELGDFVDQPYLHELTENEEEITLRLVREGGLWREGTRQPLRVEKALRLRAGVRGFEVAYRYRNLSGSPLHAVAAVETHLNLLAAQAADRFLVIDGQKASPPILGASGAAQAVTWVALVDARHNWHVRLVATRPADFVRHPVRTVSLSEAGAESNDQGLALLFCLPLDLGPGEEETFGLQLSVSEGLPELRRRSGAPVGKRGRVSPASPRKRGQSRGAMSRGAAGR